MPFEPPCCVLPLVICPWPLTEVVLWLLALLLNTGCLLCQVFIMAQTFPVPIMQGIQKTRALSALNVGKISRPPLQRPIAHETSTFFAAISSSDASSGAGGSQLIKAGCHTSEQHGFNDGFGLGGIKPVEKTRCPVGNLIVRENGCGPW